MALRFFVVPVRDSGVFEQDFNGFLAGHKVVSIQRQLIDQGVGRMRRATNLFDQIPELQNLRLAFYKAARSTWAVHGTPVCSQP